MVSRQQREAPSEMSKIAIGPDDWVVVCDGRKWLILENKGNAQRPNLVTREKRTDENPPTHEQGTDRPGRARASVGGARSAVGQTDWHIQGEQEFLTALAGRLDKAVKAGDVRGIVLVAPPKALGMIRPQLSAAVAALLRGQVDKDYTGLPVDQIERRLRG
jgi:protein required for attachment to host cells